MKNPSRSRTTLHSITVLLSLVCAFDACNSTKGTDSQTNWLSPCEHELDCGAGLQCFCGTCTTACASGCRTLGSGASCITVSASAAGSCAPALPAGGVCSLSCTRDADCTGHGAALRCIGGACLVAQAASADAGSSSGGSPGAGGQSGSAGTAGQSGSAGAAGGASSASTGGANGGDAGLAATTAPLLVSIGQFPPPRASGTGISNGIVRGFLPPRCVRKVFGTCLVDNCLVRRDGNLYGLTGVSAGVVTIQGGTGADVVLTPDPFGVYPLFSVAPARWHAGDLLQITATGGDVPAFSATLSLLTPLVLISPDPVGNTATVIDRTKGVTVTWVPTTETVSVGAYIQPSNGDTWDQIQGTCEFPGGAGTATLPAEFFTDFPTAEGSLYAGHSQVKTQTAGAHPVRLLTLHGPSGIPIMVQ